MNKSRSLAILSLTALTALLVALIPGGRGSAQESAGSPRTISVTGTGTITITPDLATITFGVDVSGTSLVQAQKDAATRMDAVLAAIKAGGIDADNIQTIQYSINVINQYDDRGLPKGVSGYQVSNQVAVTTDDVKGLGKLIDDVVAAGANSIWGINFLASDSTNALSQARLLAVADAEAKAGELAKAAGVTLGPVLTLTETSNTPGPVLRERASADALASTSTPIQSGYLQVQVSVAVTYAID